MIKSQFAILDNCITDAVGTHSTQVMYELLQAPGAIGKNPPGAGHLNCKVSNFQRHKI